MKKFLSMVLTVVMVLSMASMAFAAGGSAEITDNVEVSGEYELNNVSSIAVGGTEVTPSADLESTLKAIQKAAGQSSLDLSPLGADYATTGFYDLEVNDSTSGPYTFTVTLSDLIYYGVNSKYTTNVYMYHYSESEEKLELVTANSFDVNTHTATFTLNSLSPVVFVAIYETDTSIGSSSSSSSSSTPAATTPADASKAPNTGAADYTAVLCLAAVVAFGAAAVVTTKSRKRA